jgi:hypothetical protein
MQKVFWMLGLVLVVFACGEPAGQMLVDGGQAMMDAGNALQDGAVPDAGAQQSEFREFTCPDDAGFLLADVDQQPLGKIVIHSDFVDPWNVVNGKTVTASIANSKRLSAPRPTRHNI